MIEHTLADLPSEWRTRLSREEAAEYLSHLIGFPITVKRLTKLAVSGTGPEYGMFFGRVLYERGALTRWAESAITVPISCKRDRIGAKLRRQTPTLRNPANSTPHTVPGDSSRATLPGAEQ